MGYSSNIKAVQKVHQYLEQLVEADGIIEFASEDPSRDAYALREGIYASSTRAVTKDNQPNEPYYSFAQLSRKYIFKTLPGRIICQPRDVVPILKLQQIHSTMTVRDVSEEMGIVGAAITHGAEKLYFPDAVVEDVDMEAVYNWTSQNGYHIVASANGITLMKTDPGVIAWTPQK